MYWYAVYWYAVCVAVGAVIDSIQAHQVTPFSREFQSLDRALLACLLLHPLLSDSPEGYFQRSLEVEPRSTQGK